MLRGSCLCSRVRYELAATPQFINHCHCSMCRKADPGIRPIVHMHTASRVA